MNKIQERISELKALYTKDCNCKVCAEKVLELKGINFARDEILKMLKESFDIGIVKGDLKELEKLIKGEK